MKIDELYIDAQGNLYKCVEIRRSRVKMLKESAEKAIWHSNPAVFKPAMTTLATEEPTEPEQSEIQPEPEQQEQTEETPKPRTAKEQKAEIIAEAERLGIKINKRLGLEKLKKAFEKALGK